MPPPVRSTLSTPSSSWWRHPRWGFVALGTGFSWGAFAFGGLWAVARRGGWRLVVPLLVLDGLTWLASSVLEAQAGFWPQTLGAGLDLGVALWQGMRGHAWLGTAYRRQGGRPV